MVYVTHLVQTLLYTLQYTVIGNMACTIHGVLVHLYNALIYNLHLYDKVGPLICFEF